MSDCKCENINLYDGKHRCMVCYREFMPVGSENDLNIEYPMTEEVIHSDPNGRFAEMYMPHHEP